MENKTDSKRVTPVKQKITDKQKAARLANLERGRKKRMESLKQKKDEKLNEQNEYDLSSEESGSGSDSDDDSSFVVSRKKPVKKEPEKKSKNKLVVSNDSNKLKSDVDELKNMVIQLATLQKKQNKANKQMKERKSGGTKIVVLPNNSNDQHTQSKSSNDSLMEALRRSLM